MPFLADILIQYIDYNKLSLDRGSVEKLLYECLRPNNASAYKELINKLCSLGLVDDEMIMNLTKNCRGDILTMFPKEIVKPEHLLNGLGGSYPIYLEYFRQIIDKDLANKILQTKLNTLPYLNHNLLIKEQVVNALEKYHEIGNVETLSVSQISDIYKRYEEDRRRSYFDDVNIKDYWQQSDWGSNKY